MFKACVVGLALFSQVLTLGAAASLAVIGKRHAEGAYEQRMATATMLLAVGQLGVVVVGLFVPLNPFVLIVPIALLVVSYVECVIVFERGRRAELYVPGAVSTLGAGLLSTSLVASDGGLLIAAVLTVVGAVLWLRLIHTVFTVYEDYLASRRQQQ